MVFNVPLRVLLLGIVLLSCIQSVVNQNVDRETLSRIQGYFRNNFYNNGQYAVAINVPQQQCQRGFSPTRFNFLTHDPSATVRLNTVPNSMNVYRGRQVIAAGFHTNAHSEHLLMNPTNNSPLTNLMNTNRDGCVVFYTLNSPCLNRCLNNNNINNILQSLVELNAYNGIKAFVYTSIYTYDQNSRGLRNGLQQIANRVPLYRCDRGSCILCGRPGSNIQVIDQCLIK
ncbi:uncharacterized protein si:dkey-96g2.1 isoform X2 [Ctenopharyngodon idella]|uniref:uncharacterized protein si:dkey-96g2.1 isoform X2 n=1 Tax=Ctenopharyngodon idella TaxID=7959 RepID=UPI00222E2D5A|nr:uncharacterized protein si:dkey-96g2.1 isoform X2 [Ctenopharyngodon idella]